MSEVLWLQMGLGGAALFVLLYVLTKTVPQALRPIVDGLAQMSNALNRFADAQNKLSERMARMEGKFDFAHDLTPVDAPIPIRTYPDRPPPAPASTYAVHRLKPK